MGNFTLEVIMYIPAILFLMLSSLLIWRKYHTKKEKFYLCLLISWISLTLYFVTGAFSLYFLSFLQYQLHFVFLVPFTLGIVISVDLMERYTIDPLKLVIVSITTTGFFITLFSPNNLHIIDFATGGFSIKGGDSLLLWLQFTVLEPLFLYAYYCVRIYYKISKSQKSKGFLILIGGIIFGPLSFSMNFIRLGWFIPGIVIITIAIGTLLSSYAFYRYPELLAVLIKSSTTARNNFIMKTLPICANCKQIRDSQGQWHPIADYLSSHSDLEFTHGICEQCEKDLYSDLD